MTDEVSRNERIKEASNYLRGTLAEGLREEITGAIVEDDQQLVKFHGMYLQDDRDLRPERTRKKMEKAFAFMIRVRMSGGVLTPAQWLALDQIARDYGNGTMRLTTRQTVQLHGIIKSNLKATMRAIDAVLLNTIAACGDVNRNVMCNPNPHQSRAHAETLDLARKLSDHLLPRTPAYREIWLDGEKIAGGEDEVVEPIYGKTYLPRKFKIVLAVPPSNDVDIFAHDLGFIAILDEAGEVTGWNVTVGGGMGMTHGEPDTYPRTADVMGYCETRDAVAIAEAVVTVQRDWGDRLNRKHARLKYTIEDRGLDAFRAEVERRAGVLLAAGQAVPVHLDRRSLRLERGRRRPQPSHAVRAERAAVRETDVGAAPDRAKPRRRFPHHAQPEFDHRQYPGREAEGDPLGDDGGRPAGALVRPAPQFHGLRRAADLRPGAGRERALSARSGDGARRAARRARAVRRRHRHPHDRLPERLRAALSRRDRLGRQRARPLQSLSRRRLRRLAAVQALCRGPRSRRASSPRSIRCSRPTRPSGRRASASAISPSAPASSRPPAMAATSTPMCVPCRRNKASVGRCGGR